MTSLEALDEGIRLGQVVGVVGVGDDDVAAPGGFDAPLDGDAIARLLLPNDLSPGGFGDLGGAVSGAVVADDDLAGEAEAGQGRAGLLNTGPDRGRLIKAGQNDGDLDLGGGVQSIGRDGSAIGKS